MFLPFQRHLPEVRVIDDDGAATVAIGTRHHWNGYRAPDFAVLQGSCTPSHR
jgi:hypothetical protein